MALASPIYELKRSRLRIFQRPLLPLCRAALWGSVAAWNLISDSSGDQWARTAPLFCCLYTLVIWVIRRGDSHNRLAIGFDTGVELVTGTMLVVAAEGSLNQHWPVLMLPVFFAGYGRTHRLALGAGMAASSIALLVPLFASRNVTLAATALGSILPLLLGILLTTRRPRNTESSTTLLPPRTARDLESQIEVLGEQNRQLRATVKEYTSAVRDLQLSRSLTERELQIAAAATAEAAPAESGVAALRALEEALTFRGAALWIRYEETHRAECVAVSGDMPAELLGASLELPAELTPSELRKLCEAETGVGAPFTLGIALRRSGALIGAVVLTTFDEADEKDRARLMALASGLTIAADHILRAKALSYRVRIAELKADLALIVRSSGGVEGLHEKITARLRSSIAFENCTLFLKDSQRNQLEAVYTLGRLVNLLSHIEFEGGNGVAGWVAQEAKPFTVGDLARHPSLSEMELVPPLVRSVAAMPLFARGQVLGVLAISHSKPNAFTAHDLELLATASVIAAQSIEWEAQVHSLQHLAITDELTSLYNHRYFSSRLESEVKRAIRYNLRLTVLMADIDHFKLVNDHFGHSVGNVVLEQVAAIVKTRVRETDIVARYGGDELAVILCQTGIEDGSVAAERIRAAVSGHDFSEIVGDSITVTLSVGLAELEMPADSAANLIKKADVALYAAKLAGRNRVRLAPSRVALAVTGKQPASQPSTPSEQITAPAA